MTTARIRTDGSSTWIELPPDIQVPAEVLEIRQGGNTLVLAPIQPSWEAFFASLRMFSDDFTCEGREQPSEQQERAGL